MARKKQPQFSADEILSMMHPDLPTSDDNEPKQGDNPKQPTAEEQIAALNAQVQQLTGQIAQRSTSSAPVVEQRQRAAAPQEPQINWAALPDPLRDPAGYAQFIQAQTQAQINYEKNLFAYQQGEANQAKARTDTIWSDFTRSHGEYAENERRIEIATTQVLQRVAASGGNTDAFMANRGAFFEAITSEYDDLFGKPAGEANDDGADDDDDNGDDNRAQVFGGSAAGPKGPGDTPKPAPQKYGALGAEIRSWQEKTGFIR